MLFFLAPSLHSNQQEKPYDERGLGTHLGDGKEVGEEVEFHSRVDPGRGDRVTLQD